MFDTLISFFQLQSEQFRVFFSTYFNPYVMISNVDLIKNVPIEVFHSKAKFLKILIFID